MNGAQILAPSIGQAMEFRLNFFIRKHSDTLNSIRSDFWIAQESLPFMHNIPAGTASYLASAWRAEMLSMLLFLEQNITLPSPHPIDLGYWNICNMWIKFNKLHSFLKRWLNPQELQSLVDQVFWNHSCVQSWKEKQFLALATVLRAFWVLSLQYLWHIICMMVSSSFHSFIYSFIYPF